MLGWCWPIFYDAGTTPVQHVFAGQVLAPRTRYVSFCGPRAVALPGNFIYGREEANVHRHVTSMPVVIRSTNYFLGQFIGSASEGIYNTVNNTTSGQVTGLTITTSKNNN